MSHSRHALKIRSVCFMLFVVYVCTMSAKNAFALSYSVSKIEDVVTFDTSLYDDIYGWALNDSGGIAGMHRPIYSADYPYPKFSEQPFFWDQADGFHSLISDPQDAPYRQLYLNNNNQVVYNLNQGPAVWSKSTGTTQLLGVFNGQLAHASGINDAGQVSGDQRTGNGDAFIWDNINGFTSLPNLPASSDSNTSGINNSGAVAGSSSLNDPTFRTAATLWNGSGADEISAPGFSRAEAINDQGGVVGNVSISINPSTTVDHAFLWKDGNSIDLGALGTDPSSDRSWALDINNQSQVIGYGSSQSGSVQYAFLWDEANGMQRLDSLLGGNVDWTIPYVFDINNKSEILAEGIYQGQRYSILLTPTVTPEPATMALFGIGGAALAAARRRKAKKSKRSL